MGKYDHIPELTGPDNYFHWKREVTYTLGIEDLWCHVSTSTDSRDVLGVASHLPVAAVPGCPTNDETKAIRSWLVDDLKAKAIITRRLSTSVQQFISDDHTVSARKAWTMLADHYSRTDVGSQYLVRKTLGSLQMKDTADVANYIGRHTTLRERLLRMGGTYSDDDAIYQLLRGLPNTGPWSQFEALLEQRIQDASATSSPLTFENCVARISAEAARHVVKKAFSGPGSEYANAVTTAAGGASAPPTNPITGLRKHKHNPEGIFCVTPGCGKGDHDHPHCYKKGGGMEGQAPWQKVKKTETAAAAVAAPLPTSPAPPIAALALGDSSIEAFAGSSAAAASFFADLACTSITEVPDVPPANLAAFMTSAFSTILDSGTTTTLVRDRRFFWSYSTADPVVVHTANHSSLSTSGRGDCLAALMIGGKKYRVRLTNCLHAPEAMINLLSVGHMVDRGWGCNFLGSPARCDLSYRGALLGSTPLSDKLCFVDLDFLLPPGPAASLSLSSPVDLTAFAHVPLTLDVWHARLGHPGGNAVRRLPLFAKGGSITSSSPLSRCESCILGKHPRQPYPSSVSPPASRFLELIHSDLCGPIPTETPHGKKYFVVFLDDHTNVLDLQLLASKDQALRAWELVRARWENMSGQRVKTFRSDNGGEFINAAFTKSLELAGIERQLSAPYAHQQNGKAERVLRTVEGRMYAMLDYAKLPQSLWGEAALCVAYLFNRSESHALLPGKTPYEMLHGTQPDVSHLRIFGSRCFARIPPELQEKLGPHSREAVFLGYPPGVKAWRLRDKATGAFFNSRDIIFDESFSDCPFPDSDDDDEDLQSSATPTSPHSHPSVPTIITPPPQPPLPPPRVSSRARVGTARGREYQDQLLADRARLARQRELRLARINGVPPPDAPDGSHVPPVPVVPHPTVIGLSVDGGPEEAPGLSAVGGPVDAPGLSTVDGPIAASVVEASDGDEILPDDLMVGFPIVVANLITVEQACVAIRSDARRNPSTPGYDLKIPPTTYDEALRRPDRDHWLAAMRKEMNLMSEMNVYELVVLPAERRAIGCRWVLEFKEDLKGGPVFKARLVAQGFSQIPGVDFGKTFAPVAKPASIRIISALAAQLDWELDSFDAKRAFLWGKLKEDVYMRQAPGFERFGQGGERLVCHLLSSLYGLKQAAYDWYELLRDVLTRLGFLRCDADYAVFIYDTIDRAGTRTVCIIAWHVDDGLAAANQHVFLDWVKKQIGERFGIADLGPVVKYLGIQFERGRATRELWMHQSEYITYLLDEHGMLDCNPVTLPMDPKFPFGRETDVHPFIEDLASEYRKLVGELLYLALYTRPDIALAVMRLAQHNAASEPCHYAAAKHVLRYLAGTLNVRVHYGGSNINADLHGYSDSDWASCPEDRISISGYVWFFNGGPVSHSSKKQVTHALSSTEAEYMAITAAIQDGIWIQSLFTCLKIPLALPIRLFADNAGAIALSKEATNHTRTKHIDLHYHFIGLTLRRAPFFPNGSPLSKILPISSPNVFRVRCLSVIRLACLLSLVESVSLMGVC